MQARPAHFIGLVAFYGFFWLALAYHVVATFLNFHSSSTTGWYMCCLVIVEVALVYVGLSSLLPKRCRRWILPGSTAAFALLGLYATHFVSLPYYAGLIRHRADGVLEAFHVSSLVRAGIAETLLRLTINRGPIGTAGFVTLWLAFIAATLAAVMLTFWAEDPPQRAPD